MNSDDTKRYFIQDTQDSTLALLSPGQDVERSYDYDPDGNTTLLGSGPQSVVQWTGDVNIEDQGIYHFGARLYNPAIARWTNQTKSTNPPTSPKQTSTPSSVETRSISRILRA